MEGRVRCAALHSGYGPADEGSGFFPHERRRAGGRCQRGDGYQGGSALHAPEVGRCVALYDDGSGDDRGADETLSAG